MVLTEVKDGPPLRILKQHKNRVEKIHIAILRVMLIYPANIPWLRVDAFLAKAGWPLKIPKLAPYLLVL